jgi:phosphatidylserine/phosphatidylglycerophosphate/cardiolipin synthase-like enzyme
LKNDIKFELLLISFTLLILGLLAWGPKQTTTWRIDPVASSTGTYAVRFSPNGGCTDAVVGSIKTARKTIRMQAYSFTNRRIAEALEEAQAHGVDVRVIADKGQITAHHSMVQGLHVGDVAYDHAHAIAHNKVILIDDDVVITGSFNFTEAAERSNAENLLIVRDAALARAYHENWDRHRQHAIAAGGNP